MTSSPPSDRDSTGDQDPPDSQDSDDAIASGDVPEELFGLGDEFPLDEFPLDEDGLSLENLGAAYAKAAAEHDPEAFGESIESEASNDEASELDDDVATAQETGDLTDGAGAVTPEAIVEGALFVGHPDNQPLTAVRIASLMRDVSPEEVEQIIASLNETYRENDQAFRIITDEAGYRMTVCPEVESVRRSFLGKVREARLNQSAIEVLSLVAYQPGITAQKVTDQRGRDSGSILNQMVRRQLLMIERIKPESGGRAIPHYYPTERFLFLFGLQSIQDLPQVEEGLRES